MKPFSNNHTKRRTALVAMLVWVFALAAGMANACLLEVPAAHAHATKHGHAAATHEADTSTVDAMADGNDADDAGSSNEACFKTCDDGSSAPVKLKASFALSDPGLALVVAIAWNAAAPAVSASSRMNLLQPPVVGPPCRVRYRRLAL